MSDTAGRTLAQKLAGRSPGEILKLAWRKYVFRKASMLKYEIVAAESSLTSVEPPCAVEFWTVARFPELLGTTPYLTAADVEKFSDTESTAVVALEGGAVVGSLWALTGEVYVEELWRSLTIPDGEYYICRAFVEPRFRGRQLMSHLLHAFATRYARSDEKLVGLIYSWNAASLKSSERIGSSSHRELGTVWVLGCAIPWERPIAQ